VCPRRNTNNADPQSLNWGHRRVKSDQPDAVDLADSGQTLVSFPANLGWHR
jgi:hypothetical protein